MKVIRGIPSFSTPLAATIGNFDGVHAGHRAMLAKLCHCAKARNLPVAVVLFEPQPAEYFNPETAPPRLYSLREKIIELAQCGVDYVVCLPFNVSLASTAASEFSRTILFEALAIKYLLVGQDFRYGKGRLGNIETLIEQAQASKVKVNSFSDYYMEKVRVSSTKIRQLLTADNFNEAAQFLGRPYRMCGRVTYGAQRGQKWGIPTANIALNRRQAVLHGVYNVLLCRANGQRLPAVANIGTRPTVDGQKAFLEVHALNFNANLYGERLQVEFLQKQRDEQKFPTIEALIAQIRYDIQSCYAFFSIEPLPEK